MKSGTSKTIAVIALLIAAGAIAVQQGWIPTGTTTGSVSPPPVVTTTTTSTITSMAGQLVTVNVAPVDQLASTALTEATNVKHQWLERSSSGAFTLQTTGTNKSIKVSSDGKIWAALETQASGQSFVFSPKYTELSEARFNNDCTYIDYDNDSTKEYVCSFDTSGLVPAGQALNTQPTVNLNTKWLNENTATLSAPADISSIGGTAGTPKFTDYTLTGTAGDVLYLTRIQVILNTTNDAKLAAGSSYVKFVEFGITKSLSEFRKWQDGSNTNWECLLDVNFNCVASTEYRLNNAYPIEFPANGAGTTKIEEKLVWDLTGTGDSEQVTTKIASVNEVDEQNTELSDAVKYTG